VAAAIVVEDVVKRYPGQGFRAGRPGEGPAALAGVSLRVEEGETVGLLGPNGAGKTTLLKIIATMLYPTSGCVHVAGHDVVRSPRQARRAMGLVTCDERSFYWRLTGRHNLSFFADLYGIPPQSAADRIEILLATLGLEEAADRPFHGYSSGMKQKLAIARGLLGDPAVILYDEPTRSLDPLSAQTIREWIAAHRPRSPRTAHLLATNLLREAEDLCDRVLIINRGEVIAQGTVAQIRERFRGSGHATHRVVFRGNSPNGGLAPVPEQGLLEVAVEGHDGDRTRLRLRTIEGSPGLSRVLEAILEAGGTVLACETERVPFDEVFCSLVLADQARPSSSENAR
jgi:ABC-2 type transport system ATP-binding protein